MIRKKLRGVGDYLNGKSLREIAESEFEHLKEIGPISSSGEYLYSSFEALGLDCYRVFTTARVSISTLMLRGEFDEQCPEKELASFADKIGGDNVTLASIPDCGHDIILFQPDHSLNLMYKFLCEDVQ